MEQATKNAFERVQTARHPERPYTLDIIERIFEDFTELHGDRRFADDPAIVCGFARLGSTRVLIVGQQKGRDTNQRRFRNFAMPKPEGYRKALRAMRLAEKFSRPIVTFIDTPGAYPGIDAEERGQAEAIAFNLREMAGIKVPIVVVIVGEGGSGGALAIGVGDRVLMMENAVYSVISPEGCAAILWKDAAKSNLAAECLRLTANDLKGFGLIDEIVPENETWRYEGGAEGEKSLDGVSLNLKTTLERHLRELLSTSVKNLLEGRYRKFRGMGSFKI